MLKRYKLTVRFDGSELCGWQIQKNGLSVQQCLLEALHSVIGPTRDGIHGCSRTDAGVHADSFVCHFDSETAVPCANIVRALNTRLPSAVRAVDCRCVGNDFHARYSALSKTYRYIINESASADPFTYKYEYLYGRRLDLRAANAAAEAIVGTHDFSAFCSSGSSVIDRTRTVYECRFRRINGRAVLEIRGNGFLYNMVRIIVGTLIAVSEGRLAPESMSGILAAGDRKNAGPTAPACGLHLYSVEYPRL